MFAFFAFFVLWFLVYTPCMLRVAFLLPFSNKISVIYLSKKKIYATSMFHMFMLKDFLE